MRNQLWLCIQVVHSGYPTLSGRYAWASKLLLDANSDIPNWIMAAEINDIYSDIYALEVATLTAGGVIFATLIAITLYHLISTIKIQRRNGRRHSGTQMGSQALMRATDIEDANGNASPRTQIQNLRHSLVRLRSDVGEVNGSAPPECPNLSERGNPSDLNSSKREPEPLQEVDHQLWLGLVFFCTLLVLVVWFAWAQELDIVVERWGERILADEGNRVQMELGHQMEIMRTLTSVVQLAWALDEVKLSASITDSGTQIYFSSLASIYATLSYIM